MSEVQTDQPKAPESEEEQIEDEPAEVPSSEPLERPSMPVDDSDGG